MAHTEILINDRNSNAQNLLTITPLRVDFDRPGLCAGCDPVACIVEGKDLSGKNWRDILVNLTEHFISNKPQANELYTKSVYPNGERPFLLKDKPLLSARQISNGYWIYMNLGIKDLVFTIGKLCQFCDVNLSDIEITYTPKSIRTFDEVFVVPSDINNAQTIPEPVLSVLLNEYTNGFRFDSTSLRLLSRKTDFDIDEHMQSALKQQMFSRDDDIYFLFDLIASTETRKEIVDFADLLLAEYGCFELPELYRLYADRLNRKIIINADNFEKFYEQIGNPNVRCVAAPYIGNKIARFRKNANVWRNFEAIANKIIAVASDEFAGVISEDDLHAKFCAFSADLLAKIIERCADDRLIHTEINDIVCYQTLEALGLPENFSNTLSETLERLEELNLSPTEDVLHTALSLTLGVNFMADYNLPTQKIYRRLIDISYKGEPRRQWYGGVFMEVSI